MPRLRLPLRASLAAPLLAALSISAGASAAPPAARALAALPAPHAAVAGGLPLAFAPRPAADGSGRMLPAAATAPVVLRFASPPTAADIAALRTAGVSVRLDEAGAPITFGRHLLAEVSAEAAAAAATLPRVEEIRHDGPVFPPPRPLDETAAEVEAPDVWGTRTDAGIPLAGAGMTICDIDSGIDVFHPLFFRADGGAHDWIDVDQNGTFSPGVDGVDLDGDGAVDPLRVQDSLVQDYWDDSPPLDSDDPGFAPGLDFLYADTNDNQARDYGPDAGFTEADPTYGERLFVADDVNRNGRLDLGEKVVALGTSKVSAFRLNRRTYRRGTNLIDVPVGESFSHGTGAAGVFAAGARGLTRLVGIAPEADLVMATDEQGTSEVTMTHFCIRQGARVVLHEYAPWVGYHLDGSSPMEALIDETATKKDGSSVVHINPAGNLSTSKKLSVRPVQAGAETAVPIVVPETEEYRLFGASFLWRDEARPLALTLEDPTGLAVPLPEYGAAYAEWHDGFEIYVERAISERGTALVTVYVFSPEGDPVPSGTWTLRVTDTSEAGTPDLPFVAYVLDDVSGWGQGIHFPDFESEEHLIGYPGTADHGLAVAASTGHGWYGGTPGERAFYSGRGHRIDGESILWVTAPDDPISAKVGGNLAIFGGTSGASPHVAGAAALLLQANPMWSGDDVKQAIARGALFEGDKAPDDDIGWGKLRIYQSLYGEPPPGGSAPSVWVPRVQATVGEEAELAIHASDGDEPASALLLDVDREYDGTYEERLSSPSLRVRYDAEGTYRVKVRVTDSTGREAAALAFIDVTARVEPPAPENEPVSPPEDRDTGCGCSTPASPGLASPAALGVLGLLLLSRRRRR
ncbi:S8 family serine peptidase [Sorangium sp. So ce131]|uniref:S8 family serine peptidase n=1 Tax=Sorangium sp. So ce131 TaxID=3133282 RepID=UPI003F60528A